ncbi:uncharacterized protein C9orf152 homolog [Monodelphis domestica]|uniref:uncharacterized protein C9orf152 homolog n=1 Tax=Monodelphis domestica TaxID=13616 RepID=UPI00044358C1|nr:uncharacterized protein C9orf152 homolog [Monodelphis domestica]
MRRGLLQGHQSLAREQRLQPPCGSLVRPGESSSNKMETRGSGPEMLGTEGIQGPWRTHLAIHRLRHASCWETLSLLKDGQATGAPQVPMEEGTGREAPPKQGPQKEPSQPPASPTDARGLSHYPFPKRKAPRVSEAARRLGLYRPT